MKITKKRMIEIIKEEVEREMDKIVQITTDAVPAPEVDAEDSLEDLTDEEKTEVMDALKAVNLVEAVSKVLGSKKK